MKNLTLQRESLDSTISVENDSVSSYNTEINQSINKRYGTIAEQLASVRMNYQNEFREGTPSKRLPPDYPNTKPIELLNTQVRYTNDENNANLFPPDTTILIGDSMVHNITSKDLSGKDRNVLVFPRSGARVLDIKFELMKIITKQPSHVILHLATNNAMSDSSRQICDDLFVLKSLINEKLPSCLVTIPTPIMRLDNAKANLTIHHLNNHLKQLNIVTIITT